MQTIRLKIRKILLKEFKIKENIDYVKKHIGDSDSIKKSAEMWAEDINNRGENINFNFSDDTNDFKKTSYMLEILAYAIHHGGEFTLPTTEEKIQVNVGNISKGLMMYLFPNHDYHKFANFISGEGFSITGEEIEYLDSNVPKAMDKIYAILTDISDLVRKYLNNDYFKKPMANFLNYLQTAMRFPIRDARKYLQKHKVLSTDDPYGHESTRGDFLYSNDYDDETPYDAKMKAREMDERLSAVLKANYSIYELIPDSESQYNKPLFYYKVIGIGGGENEEGKTLTNQMIIDKYIDGSIDPRIKATLDGTIKIAAAKLFGNLPDEYLQKFKEMSPNSFGESGEIVITEDLLQFMKKYGRKSFCPTCQSYNPKRLVQVKVKNLVDYFKLNNQKRIMLDRIVKDAGIINFDGFGYLKEQLKETNVKSRSKKEISEINESNEDINFYEGLSFDEIYNRTRNERLKKEAKQLNEIRKKTISRLTLLLKNF